MLIAASQNHQISFAGIPIQAHESQSNGRVIHYLGNDDFIPAGVPSVHIRFVSEGEKVSSLTISGSVPELKLGRTGS
jgi:hypothetical protein